MVPFNLMKINGNASYLNTGIWSKKAIQEAKGFGKVTISGDSSDKNFNYIPKNYEIPDNMDYFHCTSNNTIYGTQIKNFPNCKTHLVCDMSSDIFSRKIDVRKFALIYAGAQKNMGPAGATLVIVKNEILGKTNRKIPTMLNYQTHINGKSMFNTPPVFPIYCVLLNLRLVKDQGLDSIGLNNKLKSDLIYNEIDKNKCFTGFAKTEDRSQMNATFNLNEGFDGELFNKICNENNISGINGHRSVGGYRASIYNALPTESVELLIKCMNEFESNNN